MRRLFFAVLMVLLVLAYSMGQPSASVAAGKTTTPIKHFIVVMQQNHTFDNFFGTYSGVNGTPPDVCMPVTLSEKSTSNCIKPFLVGNHPLTDLNHSSITFQSQYQGGEMNGFVSALNDLNQDGMLSMGYYDDKDIPYYWNLADHYVLFDNYFSSAHTGSINNRMFSVSGRAAGADNRIPPEGYGDIVTIFDRLEERGITWKYYVKDYQPDLNYRSLSELDYLPPQVQWVPLLGFDRFLDDPELFSHIVDLDEYYTDLENGTLPEVSYVLLLGASDHPISDLELGQRTIRTMIQMLMESSAWDNSAFFITYDDWGGWYDHVLPPQVDEFGYGFRVPGIMVSPYARSGVIDHTLLDHTSILKFIESNWNIPPLAKRDARANNFTSAFDFASPPREPIFVPVTREAPQPRIEPRRIVIYAVYGTAMLFAALILIRAGLTRKRLPGIQSTPVQEESHL